MSKWVGVTILAAGVAVLSRQRVTSMVPGGGGSGRGLRDFA
jgi:hypothetical protein